MGEDKKKIVYLVCDWSNFNGPEHNNGAAGRLLSEDGTCIAALRSSNFAWLRSDLLSLIKNVDDYNVIDYIGIETPEHLSMPDCGAF